jgi:mono/diheme cytochrome c family protein
MRLRLALAWFLISAVPALAQTPSGNAEAGKAIALRSCANCHLVADQQPRPGTDGVPTFAAIARNPKLTGDNLSTFLQAPHPPMPDLALTRREIADLAAYIATLKSR